MTSQIEYLTIGHIANDVEPGGDPTHYKVGGTVAYSGQTAYALGLSTAIVTSAAADFDFDKAVAGITVHNIVAPETTVFENVYKESGRYQIIHHQAAKILAEHIPPAWQKSPIVHLAPIANEVEPAMIHLFPNSLVGLTPQGWLRRWDETGRVLQRDWCEAVQVLPQADVVILSRQDLLNESMLTDYSQWSNLLVVTEGARGCTVYLNNEAHHFAAPPATEIEPTGAGDIFAAAFLVHYQQTEHNPWAAAQFANKIAASTVSQTSLEAKVAQVKQQLLRN